MAEEKKTSRTENPDEDAEFTLRWVTSEEAQPHAEREGVTRADLDVAPEVIAAAFEATAGAREMLAAEPRLADISMWRETAYFSVCQKRGSALFLDVWDSDQFDGSTDMQRSLSDCRVWFSDRGYVPWGSGETRTGRINCYFRAPVNGQYRCTASLQSYPANSQAGVECLIGSSSFGPLTVFGTKHQPHMAQLNQGYHHFRIRQRYGGLFFLALKVELFNPPVVET